jgi:hypothetical protein
MTEIYLTDNRTVAYENVTIKANGWLKCYDDLYREDGSKKYDNLQHYPPHAVENVQGDVSYESPHGRV